MRVWIRAICQGSAWGRRSRASAARRGKRRVTAAYGRGTSGEPRAAALSSAWSRARLPRAVPCRSTCGSSLSRGSAAVPRQWTTFSHRRNSLVWRCTNPHNGRRHRGYVYRSMNPVHNSIRFFLHPLQIRSRKSLDSGSVFRFRHLVF